MKFCSTRKFEIQTGRGVEGWSRPYKNVSHHQTKQKQKATVNIEAEIVLCDTRACLKLNRDVDDADREQKCRWTITSTFTKRKINWERKGSVTAFWREKLKVTWQWIEHLPSKRFTKSLILKLFIHFEGKRRITSQPNDNSKKSIHFKTIINVFTVTQLSIVPQNLQTLTYFQSMFDEFVPQNTCSISNALDPFLRPSFSFKAAVILINFRKELTQRYHAAASKIFLAAFCFFLLFFGPWNNILHIVLWSIKFPKVTKHRRSLEVIASFSPYQRRSIIAKRVGKLATSRVG